MTAARFALLLTLPAVLYLLIFPRALDHELVWMDETEIGAGEIIVPADDLASAFGRPLHASGVAGMDELRNPYYRPLQILGASLIHQRHGPAARPQRALSLAFGLADVLLFAGLAGLLFRRLGPALFAACVVAVHPVGIEPWTWISASSEALGAALVLVCLLFGWRAAETEGRGRSLLFAVLCLASFALALLAKEKSVIAPALLLALFVSRSIAPEPADARRPDLRMAAGLLIAQGLVAVGYLGLLRPMALGGAVGGAPSIAGSRIVHLASAVANWPAELAWILLPLRSTTSDAIDIVRSLASFEVGVGVALAGLSAIAWVWLLRRGHGIAAFGLLWLWIAFLPTSNLVPQIHARADRYLFLSAMGAALLASAGGTQLLRQLAPRGRIAVGVALGAIAVAGLAQRSVQRIPDWQSTRTLFERDVADDPSYREGRFHLVQMLLRTGEIDAANDHIDTLLSQLPAETGRASYVNPIGLQQLACRTRLRGGRYAEVLAGLEDLARRRPQVAEIPALRLCRAEAKQGLGQHREALVALRDLAASLSGPPPAQLSLARARSHLALGQRGEARRWLARAEYAAGDDTELARNIAELQRALRAGAPR